MEKVNHPKHYNRPGRKECIEEMLDIYGPEKVSAFCELNAYKYRYRAGLKGNKDEDLKKADWYLKKMNEISKEDYYMREILFKAKVKIWRDIPKDEWWVEGLLQKMWGEWHIINPNDENTAYPIDPTTICQFTGFNDKNGNCIWENDVLHNKERKATNVSLNGDFVMSHFWINESKFKVEFTPDSLMNVQRSVNSSDITCEVIGNIFDNPELLKGE